MNRALPLPCLLSQLSERGKKKQQKELRRGTDPKQGREQAGWVLFQAGGSLVGRLFCEQYFTHFALHPHNSSGSSYYPRLTNALAEAPEGSALAQGHITTNVNGNPDLSHP